MDIIEVFKPNMYVTLSMSDTDWDSSPSVVEKSVNVSNRLFKSCLNRHQESYVNIYYIFLFKFVQALHVKFVHRGLYAGGSSNYFNLLSIIFEFYNSIIFDISIFQ